MALETDMVAVLLACCPRVYPGAAPAGVTMPYVTWQHIGGPSLRYIDGQAPDKRRPEIQVEAWASTPAAAFALIQRIEDALCKATTFVASPQSDPVSTFDDMDIASGYLQAFQILGDR